MPSNCDMFAQAEPMEMALCERHSLVIRVGQPYVFRPVGNCASCAAAVEAAREAYGESLGAPVVNQHGSGLAGMKPYATCAIWADDDGETWQQWHDDNDPMPKEWDDRPPDEVVNVYSEEQVRSMLASELARVRVLVLDVLDANMAVGNGNPSKIMTPAQVAAWWQALREAVGA